MNHSERHGPIIGSARVVGGLQLVQSGSGQFHREQAVYAAILAYRGLRDCTTLRTYVSGFVT